MNDDMNTVFIDEQDIRRIREALRDYYGTAVFSGMPAAVFDLNKVDSMSDEEIVRDAYDKGIIR